MGAGENPNGRRRRGMARSLMIAMHDTENGEVGVVEVGVTYLMVKYLEGVAIVARMKFFWDYLLVQSLAVTWEGE
eukprot:13289174-Ditylum_brightwellii.AAC.1